MELAKAQSSFLLVGGRQGRQQAWSSYSRMVADEANLVAGAASAAQPVTEFRPSFKVLPDDTTIRHYQLLAVRAKTPGPMKLALAEEVYRFSSRANGKGKGAKPCTDTCPANCCAGIQIRWMEETKKLGTFITSSMHPTELLDPHNLAASEPTVCYEIPFHTLKFGEKNTSLCVTLSDAAYKSFREVDG